MRVMNMIVVLSGLIILSPRHGMAEVDTPWTRTYPYTTSDAWMWGGGPSVEQTRDGGFIVAMKTREWEDNPLAVKALQVVKTNDLGEVLWTQSYDFGPFLTPLLTSDISIRQLCDGDYVLCGGFALWGSGSGWLMRLDAAGDSLWTQTAGGINTCIQQTIDDGFIMAGWRPGGCTTGERATLTKTDGDGNVEWYGEWPEYTGFQHVVELRDGSGYAMTGWRMMAGSYEVYFVKTDLDGIEVANRTYGAEGGHWDWGSEICETSDDGFIICGQLDKTFAYLIRTGAAGDTLWTRKYGSGALAHSVVETSRGNFLAVGQRLFSQAWILETDAAGDTLWSETHDIFDDAEFARRIRRTYDGGYIIAGGGKSHPDQPYHLFLMRLEESVTGVSPSGAAMPSAVHLQANVPNPFNPTTTIRYYIPEPGEVLLRIYDLAGRQIRTLVQAWRHTGTHTIRWDGTNEAGTPVAGGAYFYQLTMNGESQTKRMILAR